MNLDIKRTSMRRWDWDFFLQVRDQVLAQWTTGRQLAGEAALEEFSAYQKGQPWWKFASLRNQRAETEGRVQVQPVVGHATVEDTTEQIRFSEDLAPDRWYVITDAFTRKGQFQTAREALERSIADKVSHLNGYAVVEHGVNGARAINESTKAAVGTDNNDEDPRLAWEFCLAGGYTFGSIKSIEQVIQHCKDYPLEQAIFNQQYLDRLASYYTERGAPILRRASANLVGWDSLGLKVAISILESLISAAQGLKHIDLTQGIGMNLMQDVAAIQLAKKLAREYLDKFGYSDVNVYSWMYFFIGDWPRNKWANAGQVAWNTAIASLAGCNGMGLKSVDEALSTPTKEGYRDTLQIVLQVLRLTEGQRLAESEELRMERSMLELEIRALLDKVLEVGDGDAALGTVRAVDAGFIDTMFSPYRRLKGQVLLARDSEGAFRYIDSGGVPLPREVMEYHTSRLARRAARDGSSPGLEWAVSEVSWAGRSNEVVAKLRDIGNGHAN